MSEMEDFNTKSSKAKRLTINPTQILRIGSRQRCSRHAVEKKRHIFINKQNSLPKDWRHASTGNGLRFGIQGDVHHNNEVVFTASFEIHPCHVKDFSTKDLSTNEVVEQKIKNIRKETALEQERYIILAIGLHASGIGFGLECDAKSPSKADKELLWYMK